MKRTALLLLCTGLGACVLAEIGIGDDCDISADCVSDLVCVLLDEAKPDGDTVCMPMLEIDAPRECTADADCATAGFPVDAVCDAEGRCACRGEGFDCSGTSTVVGEHTCRCLPLLADGRGECEDDNQCPFACAAGSCTDGAPGSPCDTESDCQGEPGLESACVDGSCT